MQISFEDLVIVSSISQQSTKGDGIGDATQVNEENSRDGLDMEAVVNVTTVKRNLAFDVQPHTTTDPENTNKLKNSISRYV